MPAREGWTGWPTHERLTRHHAPLIARAIAGTIPSPRDLAAAALKLPQADGVDPRPTLRHLTEQHSTTPGAGPLRGLYAQAWVDARPHARHALAALHKDDDPSTDDDVEAAAVAGIDWDTWTPGDPQGADLADSLTDLLDGADITIRGITGTTLDRLAGLLSDGVRNGDSTQTLADSITGLIGDPDRAYTIATTEVTRAMTAASLDTYTQAGITYKRFLTAEDPVVCPPCAANEDDGAVPITGDFPNGDSPVHPTCRCTVLPADGPD